MDQLANQILKVIQAKGGAQSPEELIKLALQYSSNQTAPLSPGSKKRAREIPEEEKKIDGRKMAKTIRAEMKAEIQRMKQEYGVVPGLAVVLVGNRPDSATYVRMKKKAAAEVELHAVDVTLPDTVSQAELQSCVEKLNKDPKVHGILVQLPLPKHIDEAAVLKSISVEKDVDGFSALNIGNLCLRGGDEPLALPCTPAGCIEMLKRSNVNPEGKIAVVLGRSNIVGMPVAQMLQHLNATVTVCHSRTPNMASIVRRADIVVAAVGRPEMVKGSWIKPGAVVIDVGINQKMDPTRKRGYRLVGDVAYDEAKHVASRITPVPGGVGPMTIAMLICNTVRLAKNSIGLPLK